jgi:hypothetical protein
MSLFSPESLPYAAAPGLSAPFETAELRRMLDRFLDAPFRDTGKKAGDWRWGVYCFYDYDGEPIYVGQTNERLRARIRRHLTNQRTDAVAMSVLDPFEVHDIEVWPLPRFETVDPKAKTAQTREARATLNALECAVARRAVADSRFKAILNEKDPPQGGLEIDLPESHRGCVVSQAVRKLREHADVRLARRAMVISRLAQVIAEREVKGGLRRVLAVQGQRLAWLAERRYRETGGPAQVEQGAEPEQGDFIDAHDGPDGRHGHDAHDGEES